MAAPKYPTGARSTYDNGDRLREAHLAAYPNQRPFLERNGVRLIVLCIVGMGSIALAAWGMPKLFEVIISYVEYGID